MSSDICRELNFVPAYSENINKIKEKLNRFNENAFSCEATAATLVLWRQMYRQEIAEFNGHIFIRFNSGESPIYLPPLSSDFVAAFNILKNYCKSQNQPLDFFTSEGDNFERLVSLTQNTHTVNLSEDDFEYIYSRKDLAELRGKKYHSKRNHIASFCRATDYSYSSLEPKDMPEIIKLADLWREYELSTISPDDENASGYIKSINSENSAIKSILPLMNEYSFSGGVIRINGEIAAFCFGSPINSKVFDVHVEKASPKYRDCYAVINKEFANHLPENFIYINREDDMGLSGLRKAKLSYHPEILLKKYTVFEN